MKGRYKKGRKMKIKRGKERGVKETNGEDESNGGRGMKLSGQKTKLKGMGIMILIIRRVLK